MRTQGMSANGNPPTARKRLKAEERRSQLLRIAKKLFSECGFENTSTKAIATAAGVSEAIIFRHFTSKEDLYANILDQKADEIGIRSWGAELRAFAARKDDEALVLSVVKHILEADRHDPQFQKLLLKASLSGRPLRKITGQRFSPLHQLLCGYIKKRQKRGAFDKCDPRLAAYAIVSMPAYYGLAKILFGADELTLPEDQIALGFTRLILKGLHAPGDSSHKQGGLKRKSKAANHTIGRYE
jgi:TetR/AcrR family transcriptional regulator